MAKELPYFRFTASEWLTDDICMESYEIKGVFVDVCAFYWFKDCLLTYEMLYKKFSNARAMLEQLINIGIIKEKNGSEFIEITFLDLQYDMLSKKRKKRQKAGKIGGLAKSSNAKAKRKQKPSYKDKDKDKEKDKDNITVIVDYLNKVSGSVYKSTTKKTCELIKARLKDGFTIDNFKTVVFKKVAEWKGTEYEKYLTPDTLFSGKFEKYLNQTGNFNQAKSHAERENDRIGDYLEDVGINPKEQNFNEIGE